MIPPCEGSFIVGDMTIPLCEGCSFVGDMTISLCEVSSFVGDMTIPLSEVSSFVGMTGPRGVREGNTRFLATLEIAVKGR